MEAVSWSWDCEDIFRMSHVTTAALSLPNNSTGLQRSGPRPKACV